MNVEDSLRCPRTTDFWILRTCERFGMEPKTFYQSDDSLQLALLAFNGVRVLEETLATPRSSE